MRRKGPQHSSNYKKEGLGSRLKRRIEEIRAEIEKNAVRIEHGAKSDKIASKTEKATGTGNGKLEKGQKKPPKASAPQPPRTKRHLLPVREVAFTSAKAFTQAHRIWGYLILSLGIEPLLIYFIYIPPLSWSHQLDSALAIILAATVPFFWHETIWRGYRRLINMRRDLFERYSNKLTWIGIILVALISVAEIGVKFISVKSLWVLPIILIIGGSIVMHTVREHLRASAQREQIERDPVAWVEQVNREAMILSLTPLVLARIFAIVALLRTALSGGDIYALLPYSGVALLLLLGTEPKQHDFMKPCKQCCFMTSIALQEKGYCLACARENFVVEESLGSNLQKVIAPDLAPTPQPPQKPYSRN